MKNNKTIILTTLIILLAIGLFFGITYAYFDLTINAEDSSTMVIGGAEVSASFVSTDTITVEDALPSDDPIGYKDFSITVKNTSNNSYKLYLKVIINSNTFTDTENDGVLYYDIYSGTNYNTVVQERTMFPTISLGKALLKELTIPAKTNTTTKYRLTLYFPDSDKIQNKNGRHNLNAKITIENTDTTTSSFSLVSHINDMYNADKIDMSLEKDNTTDGNIRFIGATPKNYIKFNDEMWRIIGVFNVYNTETKKNENLVKIIRNEPLYDYYSWDSSETSINDGHGINEWSQADLMTELNTDYIDTSKTNGTSLWYTVNYLDDERTAEPSKTAIHNYSDNIKSSSIDKIASVRWNLGGIENGTPGALDSYNQERGTNHVNSPTDGITRTNYWDGKIGLMYPSDYGYASTDTTCRENMSSAIDDNASYCKNNNWLYIEDDYQWTLSPSIYAENSGKGVHPNGHVQNFWNSSDLRVRPTIYLKSDVMISGGTGSEKDPYEISSGETEVTASFANDSWEEIANNVANGKASIYNIGDEKEIEIGDTSYTVRIANNSTPDECSGDDFSETACGFVIEFVDIIEEREMSSTGDYTGGWESSELRDYLNSDFIKNLPTDLQNLIIETKVISGYSALDSNSENFETYDQIYLLSVHEIHDMQTDFSLDSSYGNTRQLDYYANNNVTSGANNNLAIKQNNGEDADWWLRSVYGPLSNVFIINSNGALDTYSSVTETLGVAPAFRIG